MAPKKTGFIVGAVAGAGVAAAALAGTGMRLPTASADNAPARLIQTSGADVTITTQSFDIAGGLAGMVSASSQTGSVVYESYAMGSVSAPGTNGEVGGLIGNNSGGFVLWSYARGAVTGGVDELGGGKERIGAMAERPPGA